MLKNQSVATIAAPEFINIEPYNPLISQCEIKVLYVGENRNGSYITKEVAKNMANSLPGTPIVAAFLEEKDDFGDHGEVITIEDGEVKFSCKTQPYGFVAPDAKVWFQEFTDTDEFGVQTNREYLMTNGYLWTGQYPEIQKVIDEGMPQSMELDSESLDGHWATNHETGVEFFIINDATFSKLCILGSDVEPCFEGASVTDKQVSKNFSRDKDFMPTLFTMMNELKDALQYNEGGSDMEETPDTEVQEEVVETEPETEFVEDTPADKVTPTTFDQEDSSSDAGEAGDSASESAGEPAAESTPDPEPDPSPAELTPAGKEDGDEKSQEEEVADDDDDRKPRLNHSLEDVEASFLALQAELENTKTLLAAANTELESLHEFKLGIENQQKDALIAKYHMLSDEARNEISKHKSEYTLEEIESKLALAFVKENVDFDQVDGKAEVESETDPNPAMTFSLDAAVDTSVVSPVIKALRDANN